MFITQELFDRIVGGTRDAAPAAVLPVGCRRTDDRRQAVRRPLGKRGQVCPDAGERAGQWATVLIKDIAASGVGLVVDGPMEIGQTFILRVRDTSDEPVRIRCTVRRCEPGGYGSAAFLIGSEFSQVVRDQPLIVETEKGDSPPEAAPRQSGVVARLASRWLTVSAWVGRADDFSS